MQQHHEPKPDFLFVLIMGILSMLTPLAIDMYLPAFLNIANDLHVSQESIQTTLALFTFGFAFGQLFWGPLSDSYGRKSIILIGILISAVISLGITQVQHIEHFYLLRFVQGFFGASPAVVTGALLRDLFAKNEFARQMSMIMIVTMIAPLIAPVLGGHLTDWFHWHVIFYVLAGLGLCCALLVCFKIPETLPAPKRVPLKIGSVLRTYKRLLSSKLVVGYILCNSLSYSGMFCFLTSGSIVYTKLFGVAPQHFGYFFLLNVIVMMTATSLNGKFVTKIGVEKSLRMGLTIQLIAGAWLVVCGIFHLGLWATVAGVAMFVGLVSVVSSSANAAILDMYPEVAGTANSLTGMLRFGIGSVIGAVLSLFTINTERPMVFAMAICIAVGALSYVLLVKNRISQTLSKS
ncbi:bicyclomycin resistance protein [Capnocytophaga sp. HP1101]